MDSASSTSRRGRAARVARHAQSQARPPVDLRPLVDPLIVVQGPRPLCLPFAAGVSHEAARTRGGVRAEALAPEAIWWYCTHHGLTCAEGLTVDDAAAALATVGQPPLVHWPYNRGLGIGTEDPPAAAGAAPWHTAALRELPLAHDGVEDAVEDSLAAAAAVVLVVEVTDEFTDPDTDGTIHLPPLRGPAHDYHAVICLGAATDPRHGRRLLVRNSWGEFWGAGGYGWLPLAYLIAHVPHAATVEVPTP